MEILSCEGLGHDDALMLPLSEALGIIHHERQVPRASNLQVVAQLTYICSFLALVFSSGSPDEICINNLKRRTEPHQPVMSLPRTLEADQVIDPVGR